MRRVSLACLLTAQAAAAVGISALGAQVSVLAAHNDNAPTGLNQNETLLNPTNVNLQGFGKILSQPVDGPVHVQPLYVPNVAIPDKGVHNVVFLATEHDSDYAFDADTNTGSNAPPLSWRPRSVATLTGYTRALSHFEITCRSKDASKSCGE